MKELISNIQCARDWLLPGRKVKQIEIDNCIKELNGIVKALASQDTGTAVIDELLKEIEKGIESSNNVIEMRQNQGDSYGAQSWKGYVAGLSWVKKFLKQHPPCTGEKKEACPSVKKYIINDLDKLTSKELTEVYKFLRTKIIAGL